MQSFDSIRTEELFQRLWQETHLDQTAEMQGLMESLRPIYSRSASSPTEGPLSIPFEASRSLLDMGITLGEGGQGIVRQARQLALDRMVAAKTLRREFLSEAQLEALVREARVMGFLEHPNIPPVYFLTWEGGVPIIAMKQIEGRPWVDFLRGKASIPEVEEGLQDALGWHLKILIQLTHALEFAHQKGILHRDLKPHNVMIGPFGEVYLLDWGLAVAIREEMKDRLPLAREQAAVAGTPTYMAPEMARGESQRLSPQTDIYLLGAILFEILTGRPPHSRSSAAQAFRDACRPEPPDLPDEAPEELVTLCRRALHPDPEQRPPSALDFRRGLERFLQHRHSLEMARRAHSDLQLLQGLWEMASPEAYRIYQLFGQVRFGFQQALHLWPDNVSAREGLQKALEGMIRQEIRQGGYTAALAMVTELPEPNPDLSLEVEDLGERLHQQEAELERLQRQAFEADLSVGSRIRGRLSLILGFTWGLAPALVYLAQKIWDIPADYQRSLIINLLLLLSVACLFGSARKDLLRNQASWKLFLCFLLIGLTAVLNVLQSWSWNHPVYVAMSHGMLPALAISGCIAIFLDRRMLPGFLAYFGMFLSTLVFHEASPLLFGLANLLVCLWAAWIWRQGVEAKAS